MLARGLPPPWKGRAFASRTAQVILRRALSSRVQRRTKPMSAGSPAASGKVTIKSRMIGILAIQGQAEIQQRTIKTTKAARRVLGWKNQFADGEGDPSKIDQRCEAMINSKGRSPRVAILVGSRDHDDLAALRDRVIGLDRGRRCGALVQPAISFGLNLGDAHPRRPLESSLFETLLPAYCDLAQGLEVL